MSSGDLIESTKMGESWSTNLASVWSLRTIADNENTHLTLWSLDGGVGFSGWNSITLGEEQEVVDKCLHVLLHGGSWWWRNLVILNTDWTSRHLVETLVDDTEGLTELLHSAKISVVAVTIYADWDIKFNLVVCIIRLRLANIPWHTRSTKHDSSEGVVQRIGGRDNTNSAGTTDPDTIVSQKFLSLIDAVTKLGCPLVDIVEKANWDVLVDTTGSDICGVKTGT